MAGRRTINRNIGAAGNFSRSDVARAGKKSGRGFMRARNVPKEEDEDVKPAAARLRRSSTQMECQNIY
jgi:hypothetical protein